MHLLLSFFRRKGSSHCSIIYMLLYCMQFVLYMIFIIFCFYSTKYAPKGLRNINMDYEIFSTFSHNLSSKFFFFFITVTTSHSKSCASSYVKAYTFPLNEALHRPKHQSVTNTNNATMLLFLLIYWRHMTNAKQILQESTLRHSSKFNCNFISNWGRQKRIYRLF